jgi:predicted ATPase
MEPLSGKIEGIQLRNFTCFADLDVEFSEGINVLIGENGLGKTHLLKAIFSSAAFEAYGYESFEHEIISPLLGGGVKSLNGSQTLEISRDFIQLFGGLGVNALKKNEKKPFYVKQLPNYVLDAKPVFIPVNELLSWHKGFIPAYENRESSIDYLYYLFAKNLAPLPLKGTRLQEQSALIQELEQAVGFQVIRKGDEFFIAFNQDQVHNTKLVANGINKVAQLIYLVMNGALTKDSILFWDEPEAGLNPKYIVLVAEFLQTLAKAGCQIFVATHDYLLSQTLSLVAEYRDIRPDTPPMRFLSLYKTPEGTQVETADTLPELQYNSILEEYSRFYKTEEQLFYQSLKVKG